ncbi:hypothetical protein, partial [Pseudomonas aeruginosa]|uniref:hypothetical protein n=1 Tax=Pseudomonas aeruginosa TaxID=287 RepID=UPI001C8CBA14
MLVRSSVLLACLLPALSAFADASFETIQEARSLALTTSSYLLLSYNPSERSPDPRFFERYKQ